MVDHVQERGQLRDPFPNQCAIERKHAVVAGPSANDRTDAALRLALLLLRALQTGVAAAGEFALKLFNTTRRIDVLQLARVERVAAVADVDLQLLARAACLKRIPAAASDGRVEVIRVNAFFHFSVIPDGRMTRAGRETNRSMLKSRILLAPSKSGKAHDPTGGEPVTASPASF